MTLRALAKAIGDQFLP